MKFLHFSALFIASIQVHGYQASFTIPSDSGRVNETVVIDAVELSRRICSQYSTPAGFCDTLAQAINQAEDVAGLQAVPTKMIASSKVPPHLQTQRQTSPLPTNLDIRPRSAWSLQKSSVARETDGQLLLDTILGLIDRPTPSLADGVTLILEVFFGQEKDLFTTLKEYMQTWVNEEISDAEWQPIESVIQKYKECLDLLKTELDSESDNVLTAYLGLTNAALMQDSIFQPEGSSATFFPLYSAWMSLFLITYRSFVCDPFYPTQMGQSDLDWMISLYTSDLDSMITYAASVETAYNTWFLDSKQYLSASEIRNHYQLRFAFDFALGLGSARDKCDFTTTEALAPASYSAVPLFGDSILDTRSDNRAGLLSVFFSAAMAYAMPKRKLKSLGVYPDYWDNEGVSFSGVEMWYEDGGPEQYGDIINEESHWWNLEVSGALCKVRGIRYEFGIEADGMVEYILDGEGQSYRLKECWNKFQADVECLATTVEWKMGDVFHTPNMVIPSANTRVFHKFVGWKTENYDAEIYAGNFLGTYPIWVAPRGHDHLLDNLLAVYRIDSSDYSNLST